MNKATLAYLLRKGGVTLFFIAALMLMAIFYTPSEGEAVPATADLGSDAPAKKLIVIDAGHGGEDGGSVGHSGTVEAGLNLEVASLLQKKLETRGIATIMTRKDENALGNTKKADMAERRKILNSEGATLCVSVHMNAFGDRAVSGPMAFYMKGSKRGERLAECVIAAVCEAVEHPLRKANPGDYFVIRECESPAVLVECGFLSNEKEEKLLSTPEYREKLAEGICRGLMNFLIEEDRAANGEILLPADGAASIMD